MILDKQVIIIAGPNGAGKTSFAEAFLAPLKYKIRFINADNIAAGLSPFDPDLVAVRAGKIMLQEVESCFKRSESFAVETTLSGKGYLKHIKRWREASYNVTLMFLKLDKVETAIDRVAKRVKQGGHNIPTPVIRRRFNAGLELFHSHYKQAVDHWILYDNSASTKVLLARSEDK